MPATNPYPNNADPAALAPAARAFAVTPTDATDLSYVTRYLYVGVAGDVKVVTTDGDTITLVGLAAGVLHPIRVKQVWSTGTTAQSIAGLY